MRLTESARNASSSAVEAVVAGFPLAALMRLISSWSYPGPLRRGGRGWKNDHVNVDIGQFLTLGFDFLDNPQGRLCIDVVQPHSRDMQRDVLRQCSADIRLLYGAR
jgi:hypothetical protein